MSTGNGKVWEADELQFRLTIDARDDTYMWGAQGRTDSVDTVVSTTPGIVVSAYSNSLTPIYQVEVEVDGSVLISHSAASWAAASETLVSLTDVKVYNLLTGTLQRIDYGGVEVSIDGSVTTYGGGSLTSAGTGPCYCPLLGIPWTIIGPTDFDTDGTLPEHGELTISGGWRFDQGAGWVTLPVTLPPFDVSSGATIPPASILSATNTYDGAIECVLDFFGSGATPPSSGTGEDMYLTLLPDLPKDYVKLGVDPRDIWYRAQMPTVTALDGIQVRTTSTISFLGGEVDIYTEESELLEVIGSAVGNVEDITTPASYAPCSCSSGDKLYTVPFPDNPVGTTMSFTFPYAVTYAASAWTSYLSHASPMVEYLSSWASPHWHIFSWWEDWDLMGSPELPADYWQPIREKWLNNSAASISRNTRNSIIFDPLHFESGISPFWDSATSGLGWVGAHRFDVEPVTVLTTYTYTSASSSLWSSTTGTATLGASVALSPSGGSCVFELDLGSHTVEPHMWPHVASHLTVDWTLTNVTAARVYVVGVDGEDVLLEATPGDGFTNKATRYRLPQFDADKFAGSWVVDNGFGVVTEAAADVGADGISSTVYTDEEGSGANELGPTGTGAKLRFEFDLTGAATMNYPVLEFDPESEPGIAVENSNVQALLWPNGPGVRFGYGSYYTVSGLTNPPALRGLGTRNTLVDAYCWSRQWLLGEVFDNGLTTYLTALYDTTEIQSVSVADAGSNASILPISWTVGNACAMGDAATVHFAHVRNQRETPPVPWMPMRAFDTSTWLRTGGYTQEVYHWSQGRRDFISTGVDPLVLKDDLGAVQSLACAGAPAGWKISCFDGVVDNTEDNWEIWRGVQLAELVHPWHGYFGADWPAGGAGIDVTIDRDPSWRHYRAVTTTTGDLEISESDNTLVWELVTSAIGGDYAAISVAKIGPPKRRLLVSDSGTVRLYVAAPGGAFALDSTVGTGEHVALITAANGLTYAYWRDGTEIKGLITDAASNVVVSTFTAVATVDDDTAVDVTYSPISGSVNRITLQVVVGGTIVNKVSVDNGVTFV